jgi:hypothetical protein
MEKRGMGVKTVTLLMMISWSLFGCAWGTIKSDMTLESFREQIHPERKIRVLILGTTYDARLEALIESASQEMLRQMGIQLVISGYREFDPGFSASYPLVLGRMEEVTRGDAGFDIAVTMIGGTRSDQSFFVFGTPIAVIDDSVRRFIIVSSYDQFVFMHEVYHAFVFKGGHGRCVLLSGFYPLGKGCLWPTREDWQEAMTHKWRDFSKRPASHEEFRNGKVLALEE